MSASSGYAARSRWLLLHAAAVFAFLYLPIAVLILYSFNGQGVGGFPPHHLTFDWYRILFADGAIWDSVLNSLQVAFAAMAISLAFGIPAALALDRADFPGKALFRRLGAATADSPRHHHGLVIADAVQPDRHETQPADDRPGPRDRVDLRGNDRSFRWPAETRPRPGRGLARPRRKLLADVLARDGAQLKSCPSSARRC